MDLDYNPDFFPWANEALGDLAPAQFSGLTPLSLFTLPQPQQAFLYFFNAELLPTSRMLLRLLSPDPLQVRFHSIA